MSKKERIKKKKGAFVKLQPKSPRGMQAQHKLLFAPMTPTNML